MGLVAAAIDTLDGKSIRIVSDIGIEIGQRTEDAYGVGQVVGCMPDVYFHVVLGGTQDVVAAEDIAADDSVILASHAERGRACDAFAGGVADINMYAAIHRRVSRLHGGGDHSARFWIGDGICGRPSAATAVDVTLHIAAKDIHLR